MAYFNRDVAYQRLTFCHNATSLELASILVKGFKKLVMDQHEEGDLHLWTNVDKVPPCYTTIWRFGQHHIRICQGNATFLIDLDSPTLRELALFDLIYCFWNATFTLDRQNSPKFDMGQVLAYHQALHAKLSDALIEDKGRSQRQIRLMLMPWLKRTLLFYDHDLESRRVFNSQPCPPYVLQVGT